MADLNIVLQPALHVWTCLNVYIVKLKTPPQKKNENKEEKKINK